MIKVVIDGYVVEVETPEELLRTIALHKSVSSPKANGSQRVSLDPAQVVGTSPRVSTPAAHASSPRWTPATASRFVTSLSPTGQAIITAIRSLEAGTVAEIAHEIGKDNGKGIGPARGFIERRAQAEGLPNPLQEDANGQISLTPSFAEALAGSGT